MVVKLCNKRLCSAADTRSVGSRSLTEASPYRCVRSPAEGAEHRFEANRALQAVLLHPRMPECRLRMIRIRLWFRAALKNRPVPQHVADIRAGSPIGKGWKAGFYGGLGALM